MRWQEEIKRYVPKNKKEVIDKRRILDYMESGDDLLIRENLSMHFTSSALVVDETRTSLLMVFHNQFQDWSWPGGHTDGDPDFLCVALREVREETGAKTLTPISDNIASLRILKVEEHNKKGVLVPAHLHLCVGYLIEGSKRDVLRSKEDENKAVRWIPIEELDHLCHETHMKEIYIQMLKQL